MSGSAASLRQRARACRRLALESSLGTVVAELNEIALDYDRQADRIDAAEARVREGLASRPAPGDS